jgi:predicted Rdx family selenoprotein
VAIPNKSAIHLEWEQRRDAARPEPAQRQIREPLNEFGRELLARLPPEVPLAQTATQFPHVVNRLSVLWDDAGAFGKAIDDLLLDDRRQRQGFPFEVLLELTELREFYSRSREALRPRRWP